jgi:hypothetical protein
VDQALKAVLAGGQRVCRQARARRHAGDPQDFRVRAFRYRLQPEQVVDLWDATAAECGDLAEGVELAAPIARGDRPARVELQLAGTETPRRRLALGQQLIDELVELDAAAAPDARTIPDGGVEGRRVAGVEYLHVAVARPRRRHGRHGQRRQACGNCGNEKTSSVSHGSSPLRTDVIRGREAESIAVFG